MAKGGTQKETLGETAANNLPIFLYRGHNEEDGAANNVCDILFEKLQSQGLNAPTQQCLSNRKACEVVRKMPKHGIAVVVVDSAPDGMCPAGKKLVRNMNAELDTEGLKDKAVRFFVLTVANSKSNDSAALLKDQIQANVSTLEKAFDRIGAESLKGQILDYFDAGVEDPEPKLDEVANAICKIACTQQAKEQTGAAMMTSDSRIVLMCAGSEAREAADALVESLGSRCSVEDATLGLLAGAAGERTQVVLLVECCENGLSDDSRGLSRQLGKAPLSVQQQLSSLKFALVAVVVTDVGNAGERANANAVTKEIARTSEMVSKSLVQMGASCVASVAMDLQDADENTMAKMCESIVGGFHAAS